MLFTEVLPKVFENGAHRTTSPETTLAAIKPYMPVMGITRIANVTGLDSIGIPVVMVCRPNARSISVSQGKGLSLTAAKVSGLMESIEGYHAENITLPLKLASYEELRYSHSVVEVEALPFTKHSAYHPNLRLLWIEGYDLIAQTPKWVPYELVYMDYTVSSIPGIGCFQANSNGLASGNHLLEATVHAIYELVERDCHALWHLLLTEQQPTTLIDPTTIDDPHCRSMLALYDANYIHVNIYDMTSDIGLPAFVCMIIDKNPSKLRRLYGALGSGCHSIREIALLRALTEAAQVRLTAISGARDDMTRQLYDHHRHYDTLEALLTTLTAQSPQRHFKHTPHYPHPTFNEDLDHQLALLQAQGINEVVMVNLTKPEFNIPVVRMVIPQLEGVHEFNDYRAGLRAIRFYQSLSQ